MNGYWAMNAGRLVPESTFLAPTVHQGWGREALRWQGNQFPLLLYPIFLGPSLLWGHPPTSHRAPQTLPLPGSLQKPTKRSPSTSSSAPLPPTMGNLRSGMSIQGEPHNPGCPSDSWTSPGEKGVSVKYLLLWSTPPPFLCNLVHSRWVPDAELINQSIHPGPLPAVGSGETG